MYGPNKQFKTVQAPSFIYMINYYLVACQPGKQVFTLCSMLFILVKKVSTYQNDKTK